MKREVIGYAIVLDDEYTNKVLKKMKWHLGGNGYASHCKHEYLHHIVFKHYFGDIKFGRKVGELRCDHKDRNKLNCVPDNLRAVNNYENTTNKGRNKNNTSGYRGVGWHPQTKKWRATLKTNGEKKSLGLHHSKEEAAMAVNNAFADSFPGFVLPNPGL